MSQKVPSSFGIDILRFTHMIYIYIYIYIYIFCHAKLGHCVCVGSCKCMCHSPRADLGRCLGCTCTPFFPFILYCIHGQIIQVSPVVIIITLCIFIANSCNYINLTKIYFNGFINVIIQ